MIELASVFLLLRRPDYADATVASPYPLPRREGWARSELRCWPFSQGLVDIVYPVVRGGTSPRIFTSWKAEPLRRERKEGNMGKFHGPSPIAVASLPAVPIAPTSKACMSC